MQDELPSRTVTLLYHKSYPEGEGPSGLWLDRSSDGYMLLEGDQSPPETRIGEKLATFDLKGATRVEHSRLVLESMQPVADLFNQEFLDGCLPHKYVSDASPHSLFGILNIAGTGAGAAMGIGTIQRFDPPVPMG